MPHQTIHILIGFIHTKVNIVIAKLYYVKITGDDGVYHKYNKRIISNNPFYSSAQEL